METSLMIALLHTVLRVATPLIFAGLGELLSERAGVLNIGLEGLLLGGAFMGWFVALKTGNPEMGLLAGIGAGVFLSLLFTLLVVYLKVDQVVAGTGMILLAFGVTGSLYRGFFGATGSALTVQTLPEWPLPLLGRIPWLGPILFQQNFLVYLALLLVPLFSFLLYKTCWGVAVRACGELPRAVDVAGISVERLQLQCLTIAGALAGLGGAYLSVAHGNTFNEGMSAGRGFIALAIVIFGGWTPWGTLLGALTFGFASALQFHFQALGLRIPYQFFLMLPYILTLVILAGAGGKRRAPLALAKPYRRGERLE